MELHLLRPGGEYGYDGDFPWMPNQELPGDGFDWGGLGRKMDDPLYDYEPRPTQYPGFYDRTSETTQTVTLYRPYETGIFKVLVNFDDDNWPRSLWGEAFIDLWIGGKYVGQYRSGLTQEHWIWTPVEIDMPSGRVRYVNDKRPDPWW